MVLWTRGRGAGRDLRRMFILLAPWLMPLLMFGQDNVPTQLVVSLSRWLFPIVPILGMTGVVTGVLNSYEVFGVPALAPIAWNGVIIAALGYATTVASPDERATIYAIGVLVATIVQFLIPLPLLRGRPQHLVLSLGLAATRTCGGSCG